MKENINEELNYMKYLLGYKKGVVISEQETTPTSSTQQGGDGCQSFQIESPSFANMKADHTKFVEPMMTKINELISQNPAFKGGKITKMEIIGGASNVDNGKVTSFSLNNDYTPVEPKDANSTGYKNNIEYARKRGELAKTTLLPILTGADYGLKIDFDPVVTPTVINTGGLQDSNPNRKGKPGQIVIIRMTVCPITPVQTSKEDEIDSLPYLKPKLIPTVTGEVTNRIENLIECYENSEIKISYGNPRKGHHCNKALYNIYANGILLKRADGKDYASLNNVGDKFDDAEIINGESRKECGRLNRCGRSNTFTLDRITNESFFNKDVLYKHNGGLVITAACVDKGQGSYGQGSDCHTDVGDISFKIQGAGKQTMEASDTPNMFDEEKQIAKFDACKTFKLGTTK